MHRRTEPQLGRQQASWKAELRGRWRRGWSLWTDRMYGEGGYYMTQLLSDHGHFACICIGWTKGRTLTVGTTRVRRNRRLHHTTHTKDTKSLRSVSFTVNRSLRACLRGVDTTNRMAPFIEAIFKENKVDFDRLSSICKFLFRLHPKGLALIMCQTVSRLVFSKKRWFLAVLWPDFDLSRLQESGATL